MNNTSILCFILLLFVSCNKQIEESFSPGSFWLDNNKEHINAHGGGILYHNSNYYWFGEYKSDTTNAAMVGVSCYSSNDLYNWQNEGIALPVSFDKESDIAQGCIIERPKVIYNALTKTFVMWFHLELKGQGYKSARAGIAVSNNVAGPYKFLYSCRPNAGFLPSDLSVQPSFSLNSGNYTEWTNEWKEVVREGLFVYRDLDGGQMSRDMTLFVDDDGKAYHIYSSEENLTLHIAELSDDYLFHTGKYRRILPGGHNEAPAVFKRNDKYYMIISGCTGWQPNAARLAVADSIMGEWTIVYNPCRGNTAEVTFNSQSTYVLPVQGKKKDAFIFMADRWTPDFPKNGTYVWLPVFFENNLPYLKWFDHWSLNIFD
jgi:hypothetical protein